ncbi:MAG: hypothetical protein JST04_02045 [Bdellovibrionales bacterium]|nr:hypothetical protein [Bdellovibrionales bacterium]
MRALSTAWILPFAFLVASVSSADSTNFRRHADSRVQLDVNLAWPFPPFRTWEVKLGFRVGDSTDLVVGYGRQAWTITDIPGINPGTIDSHALILGARQYVARTGAIAEYDAWLAHETFLPPDGRALRGWSLSNEFFGGYVFFLGATHATVTPGLNAGFWSWKSYGHEQPIDDRYQWTILPKVLGGAAFD